MSYGIKVVIGATLILDQQDFILIKIYKLQSAACCM